MQFRISVRIVTHDHNIAILKIPRWRVQDIDDEDDWKRAELLAPLIFSASKGNFI